MTFVLGETTLFSAPVVSFLTLEYLQEQLLRMSLRNASPDQLTPGRSGEKSSEASSHFLEEVCTRAL